MCCILSGEPIEATDGTIKTYQGRQKFQTQMLTAPCAGGCGTFMWCLGQFIPATCGITQCLLRRKILQYDMTKYSCFQGQFNVCCCVKAGSCGEQNCPNFCAFLEGCICNFAAVSASRNYTMEKYDLTSDPCDYRLIRINNCLQLLACLCSIAAIIEPSLRELSNLINWIADLFYHTVSGCMTAQVSHEIDYQVSIGNADGAAQQVVAVEAYDDHQHKGGHHGHHHGQHHGKY